jgi:excisionase family DNA binding protein
MENYLTTKQVQDLFKIDRITVYRMLQDGRLKGVKIGNQWRFPQREVEKLLNGETVDLPVVNESDSVFPIHCVQTIQNLFTSVSHHSALIIDQKGEKVTQISQPGPICQLLLSTEKGQEICEAAWRKIAEQAKGREELFTCHSGLKYFGSVILTQNKKQGVFLAGEFYLETEDPDVEKEILKETARHCGIDEHEMLNAYQKVPHLSREEQQHLAAQPAAAANAVESILNERSAFMERLQQIASLTQKL